MDLHVADELKLDVGEAFWGDQEVGGAPLLVDRDVHGADGGGLAETVGHDAAVGAVLHLLHEVVVGVEDGEPSLGEGFDDLALGGGDVLAAAELADVRGTDVGDDADVRLGDPG
ncbi:hypothetical protein JCM4814A_90370 [Streptomyces phaeofaciens JCM 4814]